MKEKKIIKIVSAAIAASTIGIIIVQTIIPKKEECMSIKLPGRKPVRLSFRGHDTETDIDEVEEI